MTDHFPDIKPFGWDRTSGKSLLIALVEAMNERRALTATGRAMQGLAPDSVGAVETWITRDDENGAEVVNTDYIADVLQFLMYEVDIANAALLAIAADMDARAEEEQAKQPPPVT